MKLKINGIVVQFIIDLSDKATEVLMNGIMQYKHIFHYVSAPQKLPQSYQSYLLVLYVRHQIYCQNQSMMEAQT